MTTPELITDEIVEKARAALGYYAGFSNEVTNDTLRAAILAIQDDITRSVYVIMQSYKRDVDAYERALKEIRKKPISICCARECKEIADKALKGEYHKTDFTEYCEQNPITEKI